MGLITKRKDITLNEMMACLVADRVDGVAELVDLAAPVMGAWTGFHRDETSRLSRKEA